MPHQHSVSTRDGDASGNRSREGPKADRNSPGGCRNLLEASKQCKWFLEPILHDDACVMWHLLMFTIKGIIPSMFYSPGTWTDMSIISWWFHDTALVLDDDEGSRNTSRRGGRRLMKALGYKWAHVEHKYSEWYVKSLKMTMMHMLHSIYWHSLSRGTTLNLPQVLCPHMDLQWHRVNRIFESRIKSRAI